MVGEKRRAGGGERGIARGGWSQLLWSFEFLRVGISIMSVRRFVHIEFLAHCDVIEQIQYGFIPSMPAQAQP